MLHANYAVVESGIVTNMIVVDEEVGFEMDDADVVKATDDARIGGSWDGNVFSFVDPPAPEPSAEEVAHSAKLASAKEKLAALGLDSDEVRAAFGI
jgi:hypothetical protein